MKIGIISDIHADSAVLHKTLARLHEFHEVDMILCAGDLTGYGHQPNEVIECIRAENIPTVKGNHDSPSADITPANAEFLRKLPMSWRGEYEDVKLYMCHGVPGINFVGITREIFWDDDYGRQKLDEMFRKTQSDILIAGHTHRPLLLQSETGIHFNPGSLHALRPDFSSHTYGILTLPQKQFDLFDSSTEAITQLDLT